MDGTYRNAALQAIARCREIAACTDVPGETTRLFLSPATRVVHGLLRGWMESAGMMVSIDSAGNLRGLCSGATPSAPRLLIGSHLDTVPNAGAFDGVLGVVLGLGIVEELRGRRLPFAIEVVGFSEEEGVRFHKPFLGSLALAGRLDEEWLERTDVHGITVAQAIAAYGLDTGGLPGAAVSPEAFGYLEIHIEQGPVLESEGAALGVVGSIVGQTRMQLTFEGRANHAGTTPMHLRRDALAAAAEWIGAVEQYALAHPGLLATVGMIEALPGAGNVIAGRTTASLDVRHAVDAVRSSAVQALLRLADIAAAKRGVTLETELRMEQLSVSMHSGLCELLHRAAENAGVRARSMVSGAGHDAMILAPVIPSTMLFVRSPGGLSHHPDESVLPEDVEAAFATVMEFLALLREGDTTVLKEEHA